MKKKLLVILGSTSAGKTDLALKLAKKFNGELISADSRQVYKGLDIGTGKMPGKFESLKKENRKWIIGRIVIYLYDVVSPNRQYNVARFVQDAESVIEKINQEGKLPIIVGGTGLYIKAILIGLSNIYIPINKNLRKSLMKLTLKELQQRLRKVNLKKWESMNNSDRQNPRRLIRYIEIASATLNNLPPRKHEYDVLKIGLTAPREILYQRSDQRVLSRMNQGMIDEAKKLHKNGLSFRRMKQLGLEYGCLADFLIGKIKDEQSLIKTMQGKVRQFVRRQMTWFKKEKDVNWFDITDKKFLYKKVEEIVSKWYDSKDKRG